ncbi:glycosyltransferase family 4 protein [Clostridium beijerinckii]|uniref:glycosyltransferase family 4 protein n=1 Tax=Clostridium beijerinckii TaxID=1520 RepID=UPI001361786F|nr:glycosyltransferase family 4 protein [Clostridium beijerinckii]MZK52738.1 glycosyltransferase [Clostridium beijerinckii]MZK60845.1 glycosyltransferase [Clostridium beijerinckii]MZK71051.1 glycosyltransferase [Clostridium beijerinckii]MZK76384.1 glycosyltransferase [Clostridium beijerinckii]MZK86110.1 glycosyltransferase [Clostridium beijerinckii]
MNITILSLRGPTKSNIRGGAREYIQEISQGLIREGHKVRIICGAEPKKDLYESEKVNGIEVIRVGKSKWSVFSIIKYYLKNLKNNTDILIENIVSFPMYTSLFKGNKKHFTIVHHLTGKEYFKTQKLPIAVIGYFMENVTLRLMYRNSSFIAVSSYTKNALINNGINERKIDIVNPGIRDDFFDPGEKSEKPEIFYVGRYSAFGGNKKVDHLIEAFKKVSEEVKEVKLIVAGKGDGIEVLKQQAKGYNVQFVGMIDDELKRKYMQRAWLFASPSLAEGFGITWIEANACGTPVVGYKIEGLNTVDDSNSIMIEKGDITALANGVLKIISNNDLRKKLSNNALKNSEKYNWSKSGEQFNKIISRKL